MAAYKNAMQSYIESLRPNKNVVEAQQKYADYMTNAKLGISGLEGQGRGIPLSLVRGQQSKLAEQAELTAGRLREEIGIAEGAQQQEQARAKAAADLELGLFTTAEEQRAAARKFAQESALAQKPLTLSEGEAVFDPNTGQIVYKNPKTYAPDRGGSTGSLGSYNGSLSPEAQAVLSGTLSLDDLTPTVKGRIAGELASAGYQRTANLNAGQRENIDGYDLLKREAEAAKAVLEAGLKTGLIDSTTGKIKSALGMGNNDFIQYRSLVS